MSSRTKNTESSKVRLPSPPTWLTWVLAILEFASYLVAGYAYVQKYLDVGWSAALILGVSVFVLAVYVSRQNLRLEASRSAAEHLNFALRTIGDNFATSPGLRWNRLEYVRDIDDQGNVKTAYSGEFVAMNPVPVFRHKYAVSDDADPMKSVEETDLQARDDNTGLQIPFIVTRDDQRRKEVLVLLSPAISPGGSKSLSILHNWSGAYRGLIERKLDETVFNPGSSVEKLSLVFRLPPSVNQASVTGMVDGQQTPLQVQMENGRLVVHWDIQGAQAKRYTVHFAVS